MIGIHFLTNNQFIKWCPKISQTINNANINFINCPWNLASPRRLKNCEDLCPPPELVWSRCEIIKSPCSPHLTWYDPLPLEYNLICLQTGCKQTIVYKLSMLTYLFSQWVTCLFDNTNDLVYSWLQAIPISWFRNIDDLLVTFQWVSPSHVCISTNLT